MSIATRTCSCTPSPPVIGQRHADTDLQLRRRYTLALIEDHVAIAFELERLRKRDRWQRNDQRCHLRSFSATSKIIRRTANGRLRSFCGYVAKILATAASTACGYFTAPSAPRADAEPTVATIGVEIQGALVCGKRLRSSPLLHQHVAEQLLGRQRRSGRHRMLRRRCFECGGLVASARCRSMSSLRMRDPCTQLRGEAPGCCAQRAPHRRSRSRLRARASRQRCCRQLARRSDARRRARARNARWPRATRIGPSRASRARAARSRRLPSSRVAPAHSALLSMPGGTQS